MLSLGRDDDPVLPSLPSRGHGWRLTRIVPLPLLHPVRNVLVGPAACRCERSEDRTDEPEDGGAPSPAPWRVRPVPRAGRTGGAAGGCAPAHSGLRVAALPRPAPAPPARPQP